MLILLLAIPDSAASVADSAASDADSRLAVTNRPAFRHVATGAPFKQLKKGDICPPPGMQTEVIYVVILAQA